MMETYLHKTFQVRFIIIKHHLVLKVGPHHHELVEGRVHWRANRISAEKQLRLQGEVPGLLQATQLEMIRP